MIDIKYTNNQTVKFILPLLLDKISAKDILREEFLGAFIGDVDEPKWDGKLVLAYKYPSSSTWVKFENQLISSDFHISDYDYDDENIALYVMDIPEELEDTVDNILDGYYSKLDPVYKLIISKFWYNHTGSEIVGSIFDDNHEAINRLWKNIGKDRENHCQKGEYWFKPVISDELFNIEEF